MLGGSAVPPELPANVVATYGLTETGSGCVYDGVPLDGVEVRVADDGGIQLRGASLLRAYRTATGEVDPFLPGGWFSTGDTGAWDDAAGRLRVFGRSGDLIITGGQNVWPDPVERVLATVPGVAEVAVVGRPDPVGVPPSPPSSCPPTVARHPDSISSAPRSRPSWPRTARPIASNWSSRSPGPPWARCAAATCDRGCLRSAGRWGQAALRVMMAWPWRTVRSNAVVRARSGRTPPAQAGTHPHVRDQTVVTAAWYTPSGCEAVDDVWYT